MTHIRFTNTDVIWSEMSVFVEAALARWATDDFATELHSDLELLGVQCPCLVLHDATKHQANLRSWHPPGFKPSTEYTFTERSPSAVSAEYRVSYDDHFYVSLQQIVFGHAFEKLRHHAQTRWGSRRNWPDVVQFGYHVRNGSFHGNRFHFTSPIVGVPTWRSIVITRSLDGSPVMGRNSGVLGFADVPLLLYDIQAQV